MCAHRRIKTASLRKCYPEPLSLGNKISFYNELLTKLSKVLRKAFENILFPQCFLPSQIENLSL